MAGSFKLNGKDYNLPDDLTLGETCLAEQEFGVEFGVDATKSGMRLAAAMMFIAVRRKDPTVTPQDIRDLPLDVLEQFGQEDDAGPPEPSVSEEKPNDSNGISGLGSSNAGESPGNGQSPTGSPGSATGATSDQKTSVT